MAISKSVIETPHIEQVSGQIKRCWYGIFNQVIGSCERAERAEDYKLIWNGKEFLAVVLGCAMVFASTSAWSINIDGLLDEAEWSQAQIFVLDHVVEPFGLANSPHKTIAKILSLEDGIYIAVVNWQHSESQRQEKKPRDSETFADKNQIIIDFDNDGLVAYGFEISNGGTMRDGIWSSGNQYSADWDGGWRVATNASQDSWTSELFIPWDVVSMVGVQDNERKLGLYISRYISYAGITVSSLPVSTKNPAFLSYLSEVNIQNFAAGSFKAFLSTFYKNSEIAGQDDAGASVEVFWRPTESQQISLSILPDFGQVESDPLVINYSADENYFSEKRPFFTENQSFFETNGPMQLRLLHTRRMGGDRDLVAGSLAQIEGAVKYTHKGPDLSYGTMAVTEEDEAVKDGRTFFLGKINKTLGNVDVGLFSGYTNRPILNRTANVNAIDLGFVIDQKFILQSVVAQTKVGYTDEQGTQDQDGYGGFLTAAYKVTDNWRYSMASYSYPDDFNVSDMGFVSRNGIYGYEVANFWNRPFDKPVFSLSGLEMSAKFESSYGRRVKLRDSATANLLLFGLGSSRLDLEGVYHQSGMDDYFSRGNNYLKTRSGGIGRARFTAQPIRSVRALLYYDYQDLPIGGTGYIVGVAPNVSLSDWFIIGLDVNYIHRNDWLVWRGGNDAGRFVRKQFGVSMTADYSYNEKHELSFRYQALALSAENTSSWVISPEGVLEPSSSDLGDIVDTDFAVQLRYKYSLGPLSNIYAIYSRSGSYSDDLVSGGLTSSFGSAWKDKDESHFLVKIRWQL